VTISRQKLIVGVTQRIDRVDGRDEVRDAVDQKLIQWLMAAGFIPVPVPNFPIEQTPQAFDLAVNEWLMHVCPNAVLLSGGNDLGEYPQRDETEHRLLSWAAETMTPVLGICRGMQMMGVWAGADIHKVEGHVRTRHVLKFSSASENQPKDVNSYHNWSLTGCPEGFSAMAWAEDGALEAMRHNQMPWEGWMWHPEREQAFSDIDTQRLKRLFSGK
jgi:gamma-glutamyl-gamma-aminobutyrate hydrolase PuuD